MARLTLIEFLSSRFADDVRSTEQPSDEAVVKARMLAVVRSEYTLKILAAPYARHPDFRPEWR